MRLNSMRAMSTAIALGLTLVWGSTASASITVDGSLSSDWDITVLDGNFSVWGTNANGTVMQTTAGDGSNNSGENELDAGPNSGFKYKYNAEDNNDNNNSGFIDPLSGGQNYDAEFLGVGVEGTNLVIAIVTGQRPDNGFANSPTNTLGLYSPGDIYIGTDQGDYGIEVGGGAVNGAGTAQTSGAGSFYTVNGSGYTIAHTDVGTYSVGTLVYNPDWQPGISGGVTDVQIKSATGAAEGAASSYIYTRNSVTGTSQHAVIELIIPLSYFGLHGLNTINLVKWAPGCGNDQVGVLEVNTNIDTDVPEPTSLALLVMGGLSFLGVRRFRKNV